jgi:2Fe-2S ferredoxin
MILINVKDRFGDSHQLEGQSGDHLMEVLREVPWGVEAICGGMCSCATCHVYVDAEWRDRFDEPEADEDELLGFLDHRQEGSRLSCQLELSADHDGLSVTLAPEE